MKRMLYLSLISLCLSACKTMPAPEPAFVEPIASCDGIAPVSVAAAGGHGSSEIRCITKYTDNPEVLAALKLDSTLLVLDIDDTLLTSETFFGSDRWYEWQTSTDIDSTDKVSCLYDVIALNYETGTQRPVEGEAGASFINKLKVPKLLLTSRSAFARNGTERELLAAKFDFPINLLRENEGISWVNMRNGKPAPISYANGIQMVTGRDKGQNLLDLLDRLKLHYANVVLIDDGASNINSLRNALPPAGINYHGFLYRAVAKGKDISPTQKLEAQQSWSIWKELIQKRYPQRARRWSIAGDKGCGV